MLQHLPELCGILPLENQQRRIVCQTLHQPLVAITVPEDKISPPLMSCLMGQDLAAEQRTGGINLQITLLLRTKKGIARQEDQARPSLTQVTGHLRERERAKRIRPEPLRKAGDSACAFVCNGLGIAGGRGRRGRRRQHHRRWRSRTRKTRARLNHLRWGFGKRVFHSWCPVSGNEYTSCLCFGANVFSEIEPSDG